MIRLLSFFLLLTSVSCFSLNMKQTTVVAGATGYIGKSVVRESVRQGYNTIALVRDKSKVEAEQQLYGTYFEGAKIVECDVCNPTKLTEVRAAGIVAYVLFAYPRKTTLFPWILRARTIPHSLLSYT